MKAYHYLLLFIVLLASCTLQEEEQQTPREALVTQLQQSIDTYDVTWSYSRINEIDEYISDSTAHVQVVDGLVILTEKKGTIEPYCNQTYTQGATSWTSCVCVPSTSAFRTDPCGSFASLHIIDDPALFFNIDLWKKKIF